MTVREAEQVPGPAPSEGAADEPSPSVSPHARSPLLAVAACAAFACWLLALIGITVSSADSQTVNWRQIHESDAVVSATVVSLSPAEVRVRQVWEGNVPDELTLTGLPPGIAVDAKLILPLRRVAVDRWEITPVPARSEPRPVVYRDREDVVEQLRRYIDGPIPLLQPTP